MQTLRKRTSPCKYKNDPSRFLGEGITFKAKLIGILEVSEARGDKMCQDALNDLKTAIRAAGEHKQRITISISIDGLRLRDEKTGDCLYHHPVHKISFIAQDMSDSRAFGYIFGSPDTGHRFFGIKTDKTASQVVISMRDLFQVVFELKKKEIEMAKHHSEQHHVKYGSTGYMDSIHFSKEDSDADKGKGKYSQLLKSRCLPSKGGDSSGSADLKGTTSEAIADLLDLEHELNSIQQGINQMDKITPSDPFGPLAKGESYIDPFDDSFSSKVDKHGEEKMASADKTQEEPKEVERHSSFFGATAATSKTFFSQFSPGIGKSKFDDSKWFDQETESLFSEQVNVNSEEPTSSPIALSTPAAEPEQTEGKRSPIKTDLFTELDPLGTGRVKPYIDKKDFFQELKNPPKKVLREMVVDAAASDSPNVYFGALEAPEVPGPVTESIPPFKEPSRTDPFENGDPFEKTDPFREENFPSFPPAFPPLFGGKSSIDDMFAEGVSWNFDKPAPKEQKEDKSSPTTLSLFSSTALRVSLPPEKSDPLSIPNMTSKVKSPSNSPEDSKTLRRKCYQSLKQTTLEGSEDSPVREEPFVSTKITGFSFRSETERRSPQRDKFYSVQSPTSARTDKFSGRMSSSVEILDATTPDPPPRAKTALFSIKPPPLPPKKLSQPTFRPPARPPSLEENTFHYDYLKQKETPCNGYKEELKCVRLKKQPFGGKDSPPCSEKKKQSSDSGFPVLPPPPHRKTSSQDTGKVTGRKSVDKGKTGSKTDGSILNIKLTQLDNTGLENLAITLGIPSENIYSMTLQELTKMLADKYLTSAEENKPEALTSTGGESFEADFDANFGNAETSTQPYDKYAVFKELIESETKTEINQCRKEAEEPEPMKESEEQEEDKYAALRQLSLNTQNPEIEDVDEDISAPERVAEEPTETPLTGLGQTSEEPVQRNWESEVMSGEARVKQSSVQKVEWTKPPPEEETPKETLPENGRLFPLMDEFSDEKKTTPRDNWATFEKSDFGETTSKKPADNENENSPFSSDGKEEDREIPFRWHRNAFGKKKKNRKDVPWQDDDDEESWDDYSPKESFCSDESSRDDRSPEDKRYDKTPSWNPRQIKTDRFWEDKGGQRSRREKWHEETEDEFEESWRKQRPRTGSCDSDRKNDFWHDGYDAYGKRYEWCNSRSEPWDENERRSHCYGTRRKRSESDNEYRKRCDSDTSDKECVWTFQKNYPETHGRSGKSKQYHGSGHSCRDCPEHFHDGRPKHRKGASQKRPSSASDSKRNYEMFSEDYAFRGGDKTYPGKREGGKESYSRYAYGYKDSRPRGDDYSHYYTTYDRKASGHRTVRTSNAAQSDAFLSPNKRDHVESKNAFGYFEPFCDKTYKYGKSENSRHYSFESEGETFDKGTKAKGEYLQKDFAKSPERRSNQWASANGKTESNAFFGAGKNNNEGFGNFKEDFRTTPKKGKPDISDGGPKGHAKNKNHLAMVGRQESSATLRKSDSINIFSRDKDPFEGDDFFSSVS